MHPEGQLTLLLYWPTTSVFHFKIASFVELLKRLIEAERKIQSVHPHVHVQTRP